MNEPESKINQEEVFIGREAVEKILEELLLKRDEPLCIVIKGEWGIGKTYLWKEFVDKHFDMSFLVLKILKRLRRKAVYVSLFGKDSLEDIKTDISLQLFKVRKFVKAIGRVLKALKPIEPKWGTIGSLLAIFPEKEFKNVIVCFDEFERKSKNLELKEVFGFISYLKENLSCKVVIILHEDKFLNELLEKEFEYYLKYKEKIIDYEIKFNPPVEENLSITLEKYGKGLNKLSKNILKEFILQIREKNIRILKRLIQSLKDFQFIENLQNTKEEIKINFYRKLMLLSYIAYKFGITSELYDYLKKLSHLRMLKAFSYEEPDEDSNSKNQNKVTNIKDIEKIIEAYPVIQDILGFISINDEVRIICSYLKYGLIIEQERLRLLNILRTQHEEMEYTEIFKNLREYIYELEYNLNKAPSKIIAEILTLLEKYGDKILKLSLYDFLNLLKSLIFVKNFTNFKNIQKLDKYIKKYFEVYVINLPDNFFYSGKYYELQQFFNDIPDTDLREELLKKFEAIQKQRLDNFVKNITCEKLKKIIKKVITPVDISSGVASYGWSFLDRFILNNISKEFLKKCIYKDIKLFEYALYLASKNFTEFKKFSENL